MPLSASEVLHQNMACKGERDWSVKKVHRLGSDGNHDRLALPILTSSRWSVRPCALPHSSRMLDKASAARFYDAWESFHVFSGTSLTSSYSINPSK